MTSTINPTVPATDSSLTSAPIRDNFTAAYNDINGIQITLSGLGDMSIQSRDNVTITGGNITANGAGITHIAAANIDAGTAGINISGNAATVSTINGKIASGTNISLTGAGTFGSPYVISASASGTVTDVSVTSANGVSGSVANSMTTPAITLTLGAITPTSVLASGNVTGALLTGQYSNAAGSAYINPDGSAVFASGDIILTNAGNISASNLSGTNTGDQTITLTGAVTGAGSSSFATTIATPGTLTVSSTNSTATAHTHAITSSSAPGAAASLLATDSNGIIGSTGTRIVKIWATDITCTNAINGSVTGNAATVTTNANLTGVIISVGNATSIASQTGTGTKFVVDTSPTLVTPTLGVATATRVGLGQAADSSAVMQATGQYNSVRATTTTNLDWNSGNCQSITLANSGQTFTFANPKSGGRYLLELKQPASGAAGTITWPTTVKWSGGSAPTLTATNSQTDIITFYFNGTNYAGGYSLNYGL